MVRRLARFKRGATVTAYICAGLSVGFLGVWLLGAGQAATYASVRETETAVIKGLALKLTYAGASGGSAIKFGAVCYAPPTGADNAKSGFNFFVSKGFNTKQSAGIIGNLMQESHMDPRALQYNGGPGRGIAQWTVNERWADLIMWAGNRDRWALQTQLDFMVHEMLTTERRTIPAVKATTTINDATYQFEKVYERAGTPNYTARYKYANEAYAKYAATAPPIGCGGDIVIGK